jgi:hypothetical protein
MEHDEPSLCKLFCTTDNTRRWAATKIIFFFGLSVASCRVVLGMKRPRGGTDHSPPSRIQIKNRRNYTSLYYALMVCRGTTWFALACANLWALFEDKTATVFSTTKLWSAEILRNVLTYRSTESSERTFSRKSRTLVPSSWGDSS